MSEAHRAFVERFTDYWAAPAAERMSELLTDDAVLVQPLSLPMDGLAAAQAEFRRLFRLVPDLRGEIHRWGGHGDTLFIEFTLSGTVGRNRALSWPVVDQLQLVGERACRRVTYFDTLPLLWAVALTPSAWWPWWRSGAARPWRR